MPLINSQLNNPDPFIINKTQCEDIICSFLQEQGYNFKVVDSRNDAIVKETKKQPGRKFKIPVLAVHLVYID
jgi:hypothetical protein